MFDFKIKIMKNITYKILSVVVGLSLMVSSCNDELVQTDPQSLSTDEALSTFEGLQTALFGAYDGMQDLNWYGRDFIVIPEVGGNNVYVAIDNSNRFLQNWDYQLNSTNTQTALWTDAYATILMVNNIITIIESGAVDIGPTEQADADLVLGEAYAIRAIAHFDLVRVFSQQYTIDQNSPGVPVITEPLEPTAVPARNTVAEVYNQVDADLTRASGLLDNSQGPYRITRDAITALQARVALYKGDYGTAKTLADQIINSGNYPLMSSSEVQNGWLVDGLSEEIFTLKFLTSENRGSNNLGSIYIPSSYGDIRPSTDWRKLFDTDLDGVGDDNDVRYSWVNNVDSGDGEYYQYKYAGADGVDGLVSPKILRSSEMYLIAAEGALETGSGADALPYLNTLRAARNADPLTSADLAAVMDERSRELAFEGHRTFDLFRRGMTANREQFIDEPGKALTAPNVVPPQDFLRAYPIPQVELDANTNMVQNNGY